MECLRSSPPVHCFGTPSKLRSKTHFPKLISFNNSTFSHSIITREKKSFKLFVATSPFETETETETAATEEKFEWYSEWYPVMPVCDLDKRVPHGKRVIGIDVVVWWDRNESQWRVFDDSCPHRLAPLSEGRIDGSGRLQCVYHGWCFGGSGDCQLIPQAPPDGPPVQRSKKACAIAYPSTVQNDIVWFWPDADPRHKDILATKKPPYIPELDDPSFAKQISNREFPYGYEVLIENLMDPAHVPYAHYGIMRGPPSKKPVDREGGMPLDLAVERLDATGFDGKRNPGTKKFFAPCVYYSSIPIGWDRQSSNETKSKAGQKNLLMVFICVPVSPGRSRLIWSFPRNFAVLVEKLVPRWVSHINQNLILDSDLNLLHLEERSILEAGDWQKACFMPTKSDGHVIAFRKWLHKFAGGQVDWRGKFTGALPPTPPREQLLDRYWTHVVNCSSCRRAYKSLKVLKVALQIASFCVIGVVAATKQNIVSTPVKVALVSAAILCFAASKWLAYFLRKFFHFHDYSHALR